MTDQPLYKIAGDVLRAMEGQTYADGGEEVIGISASATADIDKLFDSFDKKVEACGAAMRDLDARAKIAEEEAKRLYDRASRLHKHREWLKEYVRVNMEAVGRQKVEGDLFTVRVQATAPRVDIAADAVLPDEYMVVKESRSPDKAKIKDALASGVEVPGATLVKGTTVVIR